MKNNYKRSIIILASLAALVLSAMACNLPAIAISRSQIESSSTTPGATPVPTQPLTSVTTNATPVTITLTEGQLNAIIQQSLNQQTSDTVRDLQLRLQDGHIQLTGNVSQNGLNLPLNLTIAVNTDGQGGINFRIISASAGPLPLPQSMRDQIETMLNQNLHPVVDQMTNNMFIESITISEGVMQVTGYTK